MSGTLEEADLELSNQKEESLVDIQKRYSECEQDLSVGLPAQV